LTCDFMILQTYVITLKIRICILVNDVTPTLKK
jgi:hypothetical protein